jgi:hypothetical protein
VLTVVLVVLTWPTSPAGAASRARTRTRLAATTPAANAVVFFHDRWHPERTVVTSSTSISQGPPPALRLTIEAAPSGRTVGLQAFVVNTSTRRVAFPRGGLRVDVAGARNGRPEPGWTLHAPAVRSLAPGGRILLDQRFSLPKPGLYQVTGSVRSLLG